MVGIASGTSNALLQVYQGGVNVTSPNGFNVFGKPGSSESQWQRIPGSNTDFNTTASSADDSVFGNKNDSSQRTVISWNATANATIKGFAGLEAVIMRAEDASTESLTFTGTASTATNGIPTGKVQWKVSLDTAEATNTTEIRRMFDFNKWNEINTLFSGDGNLGNIESIDYFRGVVISDKAPPSGTTKTISIDNVPLLTFKEVSRANSITLNQATSTGSDGDFKQARQTKMDSFVATSTQISLEIGRIHTTEASRTFLKELKNGDTRAYFIRPNVKAQYGFFGFFQISDKSISSSRGSVNTDNISLVSNTPDINNLQHSFRWYFSLFGTGGLVINEALKVILEQWQDDGCFWLRSLPEGKLSGSGNSGQAGVCIITGANFSTDLTSMNTFDFTFQGISDVFEVKPDGSIAELS